MTGISCSLFKVLICIITIFFGVPCSFTLSPLIRQLKEVMIDRNTNQIYKSPFTVCPTVILVVNESFNSHFIEAFVDVFTATNPIMVLQSDNIFSVDLERHQQENACYQLVQLTSNSLLQSEQVYTNLKEVFHIKFTYLVSTLDLKDSDQLLKNIQSENVVLIALNSSMLLDSFQVYQWRIDGHIHHQNNIVESINYLTKFKENNNNLMGRKLRIGTLHFPPAVIIKNDNSSGDIVVDGVETALIHLLGDCLNFTINYVFPDPSELWGYVTSLENGGVAATGLRGMLYRKEIDVCFGEMFTIYNKLLTHSSYSGAFKTNYECFLVPSPKPYPRWMAVILPFSFWTWIIIFFSIILAVFALHLVAQWAKNTSDTYFGDSLLSFLYISGNLLNVPQPRGIHSIPNRFFMVSWLFAATIISSAYRSGLISFLTQPSLPYPIQTIEQLVKSPISKATYDMYFVNSTSNSTDLNRRNLAQQMIPTYNMSYMFSLLDSGEWALDSTIDRLLYEAVLRYPINSHKDPPFYLMKECIFPTLSSFGLQNYSPLKPYFDRKILRFVETGLVEYHRSQFIKELRHLQQGMTTSKEMKPFSLSNLQGVFWVFILGISVSIVVFILELLIQCYYIFIT